LPFKCNLQRYNAVSGTARQHVADDYAARVAGGLAAVQPQLANMLITTVAKPPSRNHQEAATATAASTAGAYHLLTLLHACLSLIPALL
jgi:hypothetical protein